ncbi:kinase-like domain-containing protein [Cyathus striatus]|nr:kinase-like domain-containing protein [Cyathus striatus]
MGRFLLLAALQFSLIPLIPPVPPALTPSATPSLHQPSSRTVHNVTESDSNLLRPRPQHSSSRLPPPPNPRQNSDAAYFLPHIGPSPPTVSLNSSSALFTVPKPGFSPHLRIPRNVNYKRLVGFHSRRFILKVSKGIKQLKKSLPCKIERAKALIARQLSPPCDPLKLGLQTKSSIHAPFVSALPSPSPPPPLPSGPTRTEYVYVPPTRVPYVPLVAPVDMHIFVLRILFGAFIILVPAALARNRICAGVTVQGKDSLQHKGISVTYGLRKFLFSRRKTVASLIRDFSRASTSGKRKILRMYKRPRVLRSPPLTVTEYSTSPSTVSSHEEHATVAPQPYVPSEHYKECFALTAHSNFLHTLPKDHRFNIQVNFMRSTFTTKESVGQRVYRWQETLGKGSFGVVSLYEATSVCGEGAESTMPNEIAVKRIEMVVDPKEGEEVAAMQKLKGCKWAVEWLGGVNFRGEMHIMMVLQPYYPYGSLHEYLLDQPEGKLPKDMALHYIAELLIAAHELHKNGIIHRDIKPSNVFLSAEGHVVLGDFGIARVFPRSASSSSFDPPLYSSSQQNAYTVISASGTVPFSAPEMMQGKVYSFGVDYYAIAVLGHILLTGILPFSGDVQTIRENPDKEEFRTLVLGKGLDEAERAWFEAMLHTDPAQRIQSFVGMKSQRMLTGIDWDAVAAQSIAVPHFGEVLSEDDGSNESFYESSSHHVLEL